MYKLGVLILMGAAAFPAHAAFTAVASDNATVQPAGPRSGDNGKRFFNVEGNNFGSFASYGVLDFDAASFGVGGPIASVSEVVLRLFDAPAAFSVGGTVNFWISGNTSIDIQPGTSPLFFDGTSLPDGIGTQFSSLASLGSGVYAPQTLGTEFAYSLTLDAAAQSLFVQSLNDLEKVRLLVTPGEDGVAATYAGATHSNSSIRPSLTFNAQPVPEPATLAALSLGGLALLRRRKAA